MIQFLGIRIPLSLFSLPTFPPILSQTYTSLGIDASFLVFKCTMILQVQKQRQKIQQHTAKVYVNVSLEVSFYSRIKKCSFLQFVNITWDLVFGVFVVFFFAVGQQTPHRWLAVYFQVVIGNREFSCEAPTYFSTLANSLIMIILVVGVFALFFCLDYNLYYISLFSGYKCFFPPPSLISFIWKFTFNYSSYCVTL